MSSFEMLHWRMESKRRRRAAFYAGVHLAGMAILLSVAFSIGAVFGPAVMQDVMKEGACVTQSQ